MESHLPIFGSTDGCVETHGVTFQLRSLQVIQQLQGPRPCGRLGTGADGGIETDGVKLKIMLLDLGAL